MSNLYTVHLVPNKVQLNTGLGFHNLEVYSLKKFKVLLFTVLFMLIAVPAMAQSNSPVQKASINAAMFYGGEGTTDTYVNLANDYENKDQYILYLEKYNFETDEYTYGQALIPKSEVVFDTKKGTVSVSKAVTMTHVKWVYDKKGKYYYPLETAAGEESVNLTWSFNSGDYSYHKTVDKNIEIGFDEYLQLARSTYKDYNKVTVSGNIGTKQTVDFEYSGGSVLTGSFFTIIK